MIRIGERGSNFCAKYYIKLALESILCVYRDTFRDNLPLKNPPTTRRTIINHVASPGGNNESERDKRDIGADGTHDRGEARHGSTTKQRVGGTPTRAYGGDSRLRGDS